MSNNFPEGLTIISTGWNVYSLGKYIIIFIFIIAIDINVHFLCCYNRYLISIVHKDIYVIVVYIVVWVHTLSYYTSIERTMSFRYSCFLYYIVPWQAIQSFCIFRSYFKYRYAITQKTCRSRI
jgi:hypothetical protein